MATTNEAAPVESADPAHAGEKMRLKGLIASIESVFHLHEAAATPMPPSRDATELAVERTDLAVQRNVMAADRSLMAWIRTALSMISFGFTIYKLLQGFQEAGTQLPHSSSPRAMGLFLTGLGTVAMISGTIEYWYRLKGLHVYNVRRSGRPSFIIALVMSATGLFLFVSILAKVL
jgi:inner membrane protein YidH